MSEKPFVFISCGQYSATEKDVGVRVKFLVEELTPFNGYFAENQNSVSSLVANILEKLHACAGFIAIMHPRAS